MAERIVDDVNTQKRRFEMLYWLYSEWRLPLPAHHIRKKTKIVLEREY